MKNKIIILFVINLSLKAQDINRVFQRLSKSYSSIRDISCEVETKIHFPESTITMKSKVWMKGKEYYKVKNLTGQSMEFSKAKDKIYMKMGNRVQKMNLKKFLRGLKRRWNRIRIPCSFRRRII